LVDKCLEIISFSIILLYYFQRRCYYWSWIKSFV